MLGISNCRIWMCPMCVGKGKEGCCHVTKCKCKLYVSVHMDIWRALISWNTALIADEAQHFLAKLSSSIICAFGFWELCYEEGLHMLSYAHALVAPEQSAWASWLTNLIAFYVGMIGYVGQSEPVM